MRFKITKFLSKVPQIMRIWILLKPNQQRRVAIYVPKMFSNFQVLQSIKLQTSYTKTRGCQSYYSKRRIFEESAVRFSMHSFECIVCKVSKIFRSKRHSSSVLLRSTGIRGRKQEQKSDQDLSSKKVNYPFTSNQLDEGLRNGNSNSANFRSRRREVAKTRK